MARSALERFDVAEVMQQGVQVISERLGLEHVGAFELSPDGQTIRLRAGVGVPTPLLGTEMPLEEGYYVAYALGTDEPVIVPDLSAEARFRAPPVLLQEGVCSSLGVQIPGLHADAPFGMIAAHTRRRRDFGDEDVEFAEAIAAIIAAAVARHRQAMEVNDTLVQRLSVARYALDAGRTDMAAQVVADALEGARQLVSQMLGPTFPETSMPMPGDLRRRGSGR